MEKQEQIDYLKTGIKRLEENIKNKQEKIKEMKSEVSKLEKSKKVKKK